MDASWVTIAISIFSSVFGFGVCYQAVKSKTETNASQIKDLREYVMGQVQDVKTTRATVERVDAIVDRFDRFEADLKQNLQERFDDMKDAIKDLTTRLHQEVSQTNRRIDE